MAAQSDELLSLATPQARFANRPPLSRQAQHRLLRLVLISSDGLMLTLAFALAYRLRFDLGVGLESDITPALGLYTALAVILIPLWLAVFALFKLYDYDHLLGGTDEYAGVFYASSSGILLVIVLTFLFPSFVVARGWVLMAWIFSIFFTAGARFWIRRLVYWLRRHGYFVMPALIVGANEEAQVLARQLLGWTTSGLNVLGFVSDDVPGGARLVGNLPTLGGLDTIPDLVDRYGVGELVVATSAVSSEQLLELFRRYGVYGDVNLRLSSGLFSVLTTGLSVKSFAGTPLVSLDKVRLSRPESFLKAALDYTGATIGLLLLAPLLALVAVAIKLDSPGPVIYRRHVLGRGGAQFNAYKFRTMHTNGDDLLNAEQRANLMAYHKLKDDPRVTRVGRFLRRYSLDEFPQLVNVLKGEMSLIGPRMITQAEQEKYGQWDLNLLTVKPGLSGLWQVSGRADVGYEERVEMDMHYIRNYTIWLDLQLLLRTVVVVIRGKGAY